MNKNYKIFASLLIASCSLANAMREDEFDVADLDLSTYRQIECEIAPSKRPHKRRPNLRSSNTNWSGYAAAVTLEEPQLDSVTAIYGSWRVPTVLAPNGDFDTFSSMWIGIDGFLPVQAESVEQIGTRHDWIDGQQSHHAWFEMFPDPEQELIGFPIEPGDLFAASVVYLGDFVFEMKIINKTQKVFAVIPLKYTTLPFQPDLASAEWILETPEIDGEETFLSNVGTVKFCNASTVINGIRGAINNENWEFDPLTMVSQDGEIERAIPSALFCKGKAFKITWEHE